MSTADDRAFLNRRHVACLDRIAVLKAKPVRTDADRAQLEDAIEASQFVERELEKL